MRSVFEPNIGKYLAEAARVYYLWESDADWLKFAGWVTDDGYTLCTCTAYRACRYLR